MACCKRQCQFLPQVSEPLSPPSVLLTCGGEDFPSLWLGNEFLSVHICEAHSTCKGDCVEGDGVYQAVRLGDIREMTKLSLTWIFQQNEDRTE